MPWPEIPGQNIQIHHHFEVSRPAQHDLNMRPPYAARKFCQ
jgi:hypothetical protein